MDKQELKKNKLDLEYHSENQKANAFLAFITSGILSFISTFIWFKDYFLIGFAIASIIMVVGILFYKKTLKRMKGILNKIENL